jgi:Nucleoside diphosphate kinase
MDFEKTLVIIKPDAFARGLTGRILSRFEDKGLKIVAMRLEMVAAATAEKHYAEHKEKPFFKYLVDFITSSPVVLIALEGKDVVKVVRKMVGATLGRAAEPGSIRGDFGMSQSFNLIHASDSPESASRELSLFFKDSDFVPSPTQEALKWNYEFAEGGAN